MADMTTQDPRISTPRSVLEKRRSPMHHVRGELKQGSSSAVRLRELPFLGQFGIRAELDSPSAAVLENEIGAPLPRSVGQVTLLNGGDVENGGSALMWLSPDEFLLVTPDEADGGPNPWALPERMMTALGDLPGQVLDLSANRTVLELSGEKAQEVLEKSVRIDLHPRFFPAGDAVSTLITGVQVYIWRPAPEVFRIFPRASFAVHIGHWLLDGMREFAD